MIPGLNRLVLFNIGWFLFHSKAPCFTVTSKKILRLLFQKILSTFRDKFYWTGITYSAQLKTVTIHSD